MLMQIIHDGHPEQGEIIQYAMRKLKNLSSRLADWSVVPHELHFKLWTKESASKYGMLEEKEEKNIPSWLLHRLAASVFSGDALFGSINSG